MSTIKSKAFAGTACAAAAAALALPVSPAWAAAPAPFPAYDNGRVLVTAHPVHPGERLVIRGHLLTVASVSHPGPAYVMHVLGGLPAGWTGQVLAIVPAA